MKAEIQVLSRETIKPSFPTPPHLQNYHLSFLDQINPRHYPALIFFHESNPNMITSTNTERSNRLKASLSESLTRFYPLAGRLVNNVSVSCCDEGVPYIESYAPSSQLTEVIRTPNISEFDKFLPRAVDDFSDNVILAIQVTFFECGGLAIGVCISHKLADAFSIFMFLNTWAETCRGNGEIHCPIFESAKIFPPSDAFLLSPPRPVVKEKAKIVTKMFTFNNSTLENLKSKFRDDENEKCSIRATRVEALTAFLWNKYANAINANTDPEKVHIVTHAVNLRNRVELEPPLSKYGFGNIYAVIEAKPSMEHEGECGSDLVRQMRAAIKKIDGKYVIEKLRDGDKYLDFLKEKVGKIAEEEMVRLSFSSWCNMGACEVDFGWGKPVRVGLTSFPFNNFVRFMDTRDCDGIEAWISMEEEDMAKLEGVIIKASSP